MGKKGKEKRSNSGNNKKKSKQEDDENPPRSQSKNDTRSGKTNGKKKERRKSGKNSIGWGTEADNDFRSKLQADGRYSIVEMDADGNCLFRSLSDQLFHDYGNCHADVRYAVCDYIEQHEEDFSVFLVLDETEDEEDAADFKSYVAAMRGDGEWGGNLELVAAAKLYKRNITLFSASANLSAMGISHGGEKSSGPDLLVSYHENSHYSSVRDTTIKMFQPHEFYTVYKTNQNNSNGNSNGNSHKSHSHNTQSRKQKMKKEDILVDDDDTGNDEMVKNENGTEMNGSNGGTEQATTTATPTVNDSSTFAIIVALPATNDETTDHTQQQQQQEEEQPCESLEMPNNKITRGPKKSGPCPCGSNKKYKKCCWEQVRRESRLKKVKRQSGGDCTGDDEDDDDKAGDVEKASFEMNGNFRVLQI